MNRGPIYLSGPIDQCDYNEIHGWRWEAKRLLGEQYVIDPTRRDYLDKTTLTEQDKKDLVELDLKDIQNSVGVLVHAWKISPGTMMEIIYGKQWRKPVVVIVPYSAFVSPWIEYHADCITRHGVCSGVEKIKQILRWE